MSDAVLATICCDYCTTQPEYNDRFDELLIYKLSLYLGSERDQLPTGPNRRQKRAPTNEQTSLSSPSSVLLLFSRQFIAKNPVRGRGRSVSLNVSPEEKYFEKTCTLNPMDSPMAKLYLCRTNNIPKSKPKKQKNVKLWDRGFLFINSKLILASCV